MSEEKMYLELTFSGDYKKILEFMEGKEWKYMQKRVSPNKIYLEVTTNVNEEMSFFKGSWIDESFNKIEDIKEITIEEYKNAEEYVEEVKQPEITSSTTPLENPDNNEEEKEEEKIEEIILPSNDEISKILNDTLLPSKLPLQSNDPMNYLTSKDFLLQFFVFSSILLTFLSLFN